MSHPGEKQLGYLINQSARLLSRELSSQLKLHGLTQAQFAVLRHIEAFAGDGVTAGKVAEALRLERETVGRTVERLVDAGWVEATGKGRGAGPLLCLTHKGQALMPALDDISRWTLERGLNGFTAPECDELKRYLQRFLRNLSEA